MEKLKDESVVDDVTIVAEDVLVRSGEGLGTETYERPSRHSLGNYSLRAAVASEMPINGVQHSLEAGYTGAV